MWVTVNYVIAVLSTFAAGVVLTWVVRTQATRFGAVAPPRNDRWHRRPTAMLGGIAIWASFVLGVVIFRPSHPGLLPVLLAGTVLAVVGLVDDLRGLRPFVRLVVQVVVAVLVVGAGVMLHWSGSEIVDMLVSVFWIVGISNALNLLDNMDGLAGGIGIISCLFLFLLFLANGQTDLALTVALLAGAVGGFLVFNINPASIFMGDCGSTSLGLVLGAVAMLSTTGRTRSLAAVLLGPVLILLIPIFDTTLVTLTRKVAGRPASEGGRDHSSHRLVALGMSERKAVLVLYGLAFASGCLGLLAWLSDAQAVFFVVPTFAVAFVLLGVFLGKVRVYRDQASAPPGYATITALSDFAYKRRVFEIGLDVILVVLAYYGAHVIRFEDTIPAEQMGILLRSLPVVLAVQMLSFLVFGVYSGLWRYAGINELARIIAATACGVALSALLVFGWYSFVGPSRAVFTLDWLLLTLLVSGSRVSFRVLPLMLTGDRAQPEGTRRVLVYGAGDGGELLARELLNNPAHGYRPVAFLDDDASKVGRRIHGIPIVAAATAREMGPALGADVVIASTPKVTHDQEEHLRAAGFTVRRLRIHID